MRIKKLNGSLAVHAIAGTHVVLLAMNLPEKAIKGLLGFRIQRKSKAEVKFLAGGKSFEGRKKGDSRVAPIQAFMWGDYDVDPGVSYTYAVTTVYGTPENMSDGDSVSVRLKTEDPTKGTHGVYFNRGVAGSQAYSRIFGSSRRWYLVDKYGKERWQDFIKPSEVSGDRAWKWLSRGLNEGLQQFLQKAKRDEYGLRVCAYELSYLPFAESLAYLVESGTDVKVVHHAKTKKRTEIRRGKEVKIEYYDSVGETARRTIRKVGIKYLGNTKKWSEVFTERTKATISHNKFIVLLKNGEPTEVWTGSTNFTSGGIFGQANVGHIVRDATTAQAYLDYWNELVEDPAITEAGVKGFNERSTPLPEEVRPQAISPVFSPRTSLDALDWYSDILGDAVQTIHYTAAFGVSQQFARKLVEQGDPDSHLLRYVLLEGVPSKATSKKRKDNAIDKGRDAPLDFYDFCKDQVGANRVAWGDVTRSSRRRFEWQRAYESLTGLNSHVNYVHTKFLLVDALTDDPILITGSANFSEASTIKNDENMLVIRGDTRVADIYLTEYMRLFNHFWYRNYENSLDDDGKEKARYLTPNNSWTIPYYKPECQVYTERELFS